MKKKKTVLTDVHFSTGKKLATMQDRRRLQNSMKSNIVSTGSYVSLFLLDFAQTEIACWNYIC